MKSLAVFFAFVLPADARLGETVAECATRYGKPTLETPEGTTKWYEKNGVSIHINFRSSIAVELTFQKKANSISDLFSHLSDEQVQALLTANAVGGEWKKANREKGRELEDITGKLMIRGDGKALASWDFPTGSLTLTSAEEKATREAERIASEKSKKAAKNHEATRTAEGF